MTSTSFDTLWAVLDALAVVLCYACESFSAVRCLQWCKQPVIYIELLYLVAAKTNIISIRNGNNCPIEPYSEYAPVNN